ncbi:MAG: aminoacyl-tRNA hydrolase [Deltaproteobacteria bacterium]|nr:aminoacyl-tRNA hydrolase [Deltaproteobacteria bacterium]
MEEDIHIREGVVIPGSELKLTASRAGGPGGQHVNKTNSRITLEWDVASSQAFDEENRALIMEKLAFRLTQSGVLQLHVDDERSQHRNREIARHRLKEIVNAALAVQKKRIPTRVSARAKKRRVDNKKRRGTLKRRRRVPSDDDL